MAHGSKRQRARLSDPTPYRIDQNRCLRKDRNESRKTNLKSSSKKLLRKLRAREIMAEFRFERLVENLAADDLIQPNPEKRKKRYLTRAAIAGLGYGFGFKSGRSNSPLTSASSMLVATSAAMNIPVLAMTLESSRQLNNCIYNLKTYGDSLTYLDDFLAKTIALGPARRILAAVEVITESKWADALTAAKIIQECMFGTSGIKKEDQDFVLQQVKMMGRNLDLFHDHYDAFTHAQSGLSSIFSSQISLA